MAFDKPTRNALSRMVAECRRLLTNDVREQLQATYGIQPEGTALAVDKLAHLDDRGREIATGLREWLEHLFASEAGTAEQRRKNAFFRMTQETAFTYLNRLAALRMCEERGLVIECVRRGMESDGFALYERLASQLLGDRGQTYRVFLECMFDELAVDLGVLFDRRVPHSLVFPTPVCITGVLQRLNDRELAHLWQEDEAVGWLYQYFNSREEIDRMRKKELGGSPSPRNSRELAVRNQFFTPRYVVEFLTDNTLGRIWYEMQQGETVLKDECRYLVRRPNAIFLGPEEQPPATASVDTALAQEELLQRPVYILHRAKKDPRDLKILDPACGSGHFLLYAFDLLEHLYSEAWQDESAPASEITGKSLRDEDDYKTEQALRSAIPGLILKHNLHGIDIDPRACQIAALSLWLRAQRSYQKLGLKAAERPPITKINIVCAEPMPGEEDLLEEFIAKELSSTPEQEAIAHFVRQVFAKMKLAGEAGSLLKIEKDISEALTSARQQWSRQSQRAQDKQGQASLFTVAEMDRLASETQQRLDFSDITDTEFWEQAERRIVDALRSFAEHAANGESLKRGLFSGDAAQGFALIDICRKRYDIVIMNPPFGEAIGSSAPTVKRYLAKNLYSCFVERAIEITNKSGCFGAITDSTYLKQPTFLPMRNLLLTGEKRISYIVDLGWNVLDANVRTAMVVCHTNQISSFCSLDLTDREPRDELLRSAVESSRFVCRSYKEVIELPKSVLALNLPVGVGTHLAKLPRLKNFAELPWGCGANDSTRLFRLRWEIPPDQIGEMWAFLTNGGLYSPFYRENYFVCRIRVENGDSAFTTRFKNDTDTLYDASAQHLYFTPGLTYPKRSRFFHVSVLPSGHIFTPEGKGIFLDNIEQKYLFLAILNSSVITHISDFLCGPHKQRGDVELIGIPELSATEVDEVKKRAQEITCRMQLLARACEDSALFVAPSILDEPLGSTPTLSEFLRARESTVRQSAAEATLCFEMIDSIAEQNARWLTLDDDCVAELHQARSSIWAPYILQIEDIVSYLFGLALGRWDVRYAIGEKELPKLVDPFSPLPVCPPGMIQNNAGLPAEPDGVPGDYPLQLSSRGILVDDPDHGEDIVRRVREALSVIWNDHIDAVEQETCEILNVKSLRSYFSNPSKFFDDHLSRYSKSNRKAPIYWPLSTESGSYTVWVYYHRLNDQILYTIVNKYLEEGKIDDVRRALIRIEEALLNASGADATRLRDTLHEHRKLLDELQDMKQELLRVAALPYKPDLNDGVIINAAPLYKLFQHRAWAKDCAD